jgi:hypothetical protein
MKYDPKSLKRKGLFVVFAPFGVVVSCGVLPHLAMGAVSLVPWWVAGLALLLMVVMTIIWLRHRYRA